MDAQAIAFAVPLFFLLIGVELLVNRRQGELRYAFHDSVNSLSCGIGQQVLGIFFKFVQIGAYTLVYEHLRVATVSPTSPVAWLVLLLAVDLGYYLYHRASHRVNFLWATHVVHHQSEEYNLSTALRQSWLTSLTSWIFYVPLAIAGFSPAMFVAMITVNTLYQFWIHTRAVSRIGFLESFLNTPSHHRVHHGTDPVYIDKNYAGIFIIWDRMFGTFTREEREPVYGTVKPLASWNPFWANVEPWVRLAAMSRGTRRLRDKLKVWYAPPEWFPEDLGGVVTVPEVSRDTQRKFDVRTPLGLDLYVAVGFALVTAAATALLWYAPVVPIERTAAVALGIMLTLLGWGALFEAKGWAVPLEWLRLAYLVGLAGWLSAGTAAQAPVVASAAAAAVGFAVWVSRYRGRAAEPVRADEAISAAG